MKAKKLSAKKYQSSTSQFAVFPDNYALEYLTMGLASEAGEVAGKVSKLIRGDYLDADGKYDLDRFHNDLNREMGDVLWFISELCNLTGSSIEGVMGENIAKLSARAKTDKIKGNGDNR